jgi:hypothetical protein
MSGLTNATAVYWATAIYCADATALHVDARQRPSDLCGLHTKKAEVLSISQKAATVPIA